MNKERWLIDGKQVRARNGVSDRSENGDSQDAYGLYILDRGYALFCQQNV